MIALIVLKMSATSKFYNSTANIINGKYGFWKIRECHKKAGI